MKQRSSVCPSARILEVIADFEQGLVPGVVPITLIRHYVVLLGVDYLAGQTYVEPHPKEVALRNHV